MHYGDARRIAEELLSNEPVGSEIFFADDHYLTPHYNSNKPDKGEHVDGWRAAKKSDGSVDVSKKWA